MNMQGGHVILSLGTNGKMESKLSSDLASSHKEVSFTRRTVSVISLTFLRSATKLRM